MGNRRGSEGTGQKLPFERNVGNSGTLTQDSAHGRE
jgi:hypothetical protein